MREDKTLPLPASSAKAERIFGLDLIRACSILMVFLSHSTQLNPIDKRFPFGWLGVGVEAFFVLSGFLIGRIITRSVLHPAVSWRSVGIFWVNRWLRTLPAYLVAFAAYYYFSEAFHNRLYYLFFTQNILTPMPGFFPHSWSLAVEEWFYLLFPLLLLVMAAAFGNRRNAHRIYLGGLAIFMLAGLLARLTYHWVYQQEIFADLLRAKLLFPSWKVFLAPGGDWDSMRKMVIFRFDAIPLGCLVAFLCDRHQLSKTTRVCLLILGAAGLLIAFQVLHHTVAGGKVNLFVDVLLLPLFCCSFALMLPYAEQCPRPGKLLKGLVTNISKTSYSFYLMHILVLDLLTGWYHNHLATPRWLVFIGSYASIYLLSYLMYRFVELPLMNYRKKLFANQPALEATSISAARD